MALSSQYSNTYVAPVSRAPWKDEYGCWRVSRFEDAQCVLSDPNAVNDHSLKRLMQRAQAAKPEKFVHWPLVFEILNLSNGDWHRSQRKMTASLISLLDTDLPKDLLRQRLEDASSRSGQDGVDMLGHVLDPVFNQWIADALGFEAGQIASIRCAGNALVQMLGNGIVKANASSIEAHAKDLVEIYGHVIGRDKLNWTSEDHAKLLLMVVALNAQTAFLANVLEHLADHPQMQNRLRQSRDAIRSYMIEAERFLVSSRYIHRRMGPDGIRLPSCHLPGSEVVVVDLAAANRDPDRWDNPQVFDPSRPELTSLAFSHGPHRCLGVSVSRRLVPQFLDVFLRTVRAERGAKSTYENNLSVDLLVNLPLRLSLLIHEGQS